MFTKKTPKSQLNDKNDFTCHGFHTTSLSNRNWPEVVRVISIDPAIRNLAIRVESRGMYSASHPIKTIVFEKLHITDAQRKLEGNLDTLYLLVTNFLDKYLEIFKTCHMVIIERQLSINNKSSRISQHIITYFMLNLRDISPNLAMIFEVDPKLKGKELGASKHLNERGIKQWSIDHCKSLLTKRQDYPGLQILEKNKKKADDLADCVCQIEALFSLQKWPLTSEVISLKIGSSSSSTTSRNFPSPPLVLPTSPPTSLSSVKSPILPPLPSFSLPSISSSSSSSLVLPIKKGSPQRKEEKKEEKEKEKKKPILKVISQ